MSDVLFDLKSNAFFILKADYSSSRAEIADLAEDAEFDDEYDPETIHRARVALETPRLRLVQEISWLPELIASQAIKSLRAIETSDVGLADSATRSLPVLAKVNLLSHYCRNNAAAMPLIERLVHNWDRVDDEALGFFLDSKRKSVGIPAVDQVHLREAMTALREKHGRTVVKCLWESHDPGKLCEQLVENTLRRSGHSAMLETIVNEYDKMSEARLSAIRKEIDSCTETIRNKRANLDRVVSQIINLLKKWDSINQPVQVYQQHQGLEEGRSKEVFDNIRSLCLLLVNERREVESALRLTKALYSTFPELESVADTLEEDIKTLSEFDEANKVNDALNRLELACNAAKTQREKLLQELRRGFRSAAASPLREIVFAFNHALSVCPDPDVAFAMIRNLAVHFHNEENELEIAYLLTKVLYNHPLLEKVERAEEIKKETNFLYRGVKHDELDRCRKSNDFERALRVVSELLAVTTDEDERRQLQSIEQILQVRLNGNGGTRIGTPESQGSQTSNKRSKKWLMWTCLILFLLAVIYWNEIEGVFLASNSQSTITSTLENVFSGAQEVMATVGSRQESKPPVGTGLTLSKDQLRYCVFEGERIDEMRRLINNRNSTHITNFNNRVDDLNSRCGSYMYHPSQRNAVINEARTQAANFRIDARRIVSSW